MTRFFAIATTAAKDILPSDCNLPGDMGARVVAFYADMVNRKIFQRIGGLMRFRRGKVLARVLTAHPPHLND